MTGVGAATERVLIHAPTGRDAALACQVLEGAGIGCAICGTGEDLEREVAAGAGLAIVADEALGPATIARFLGRLEEQPVWSDLPVLVLTHEGRDVQPLIAALGPTVNATLLERPVRIQTLVSAVLAALRARRRQYEVRDLVHRLAESDRRKDEFLAMLGHELRNPLGAISTAVTILRQEGIPPESEARQIALIQRQVRHLARMVDDLLDLSRLSLGKINLKPEPVTLQEVVRSAVETLDMAGRNGRHEVSVRLAEEPLVVSGDPVRLEQVVANLLQNALKYTPAGGAVEVSVERRGVEGAIRVCDEGVGIPADQLAGIFDPFTQLGGAGTGSDSEAGLGVGLYLTQRLVDLHGGRIEAGSDGPGCGAEFLVRLPLAAAGSAAGGAAPARAGVRTPRAEEAPPMPRPVAAGRELRVLLVEDNPFAREALEELLRIWGCRFEAVATGAEAVDRAAAAPPDLALIDIGLPDTDGYQVARRLRDALAGRPDRLVALTGFGQSDDRRQALEAGFDEHLVKPVAPEKLAALVRSAAGR